MIVADTSVWIEFFRDRPSAQVERLAEALEDDDVVVGDVVLLEVLQGAPSEAEARRIERLMSFAPVVPMLDPACGAGGGPPPGAAPPRGHDPQDAGPDHRHLLPRRGAGAAAPRPGLRRHGAPPRAARGGGLRPAGVACQAARGRV